MLRSILVGLDGSVNSTAAMHLGMKWARRADALLVGLAIIDEPTIAAASPVMIGGAPYSDPVIFRERMEDSRRQVDQFLEQFALECAAEGVACKVLEDIGLPCEQIALEAQRYDLIVLGQRTHFDFEVSKGPDITLPRVLKASPRPVVVVPLTPVEGRSVVVAYDGSLQAARALDAFKDMDLQESREVDIVSVHPEKVEAARHAERAIDFLRFHDIRAVAHPVASAAAPAREILEKVRELEADLVVAGAYGQPTLKEFFVGSTSRTLLNESPVPLFLFH